MEALIESLSWEHLESLAKESDTLSLPEDCCCNRDEIDVIYGNMTDFGRHNGKSLTFQGSLGSIECVESGSFD